MFGVREFGFPPDLQNDCEVVLARASNGVSGTGICCAGGQKSGRTGAEQRRQGQL